MRLGFAAWQSIIGRSADKGAAPLVAIHSGPAPAPPAPAAVPAAAEEAPGSDQDDEKDPEAGNRHREGQNRRPHRHLLLRSDLFLRF